MRAVTADRAAFQSGRSPKMSRVRAPAVQLGHRGDDRVVGEGTIAAGIDLAGHEIAPDGVERRGPAIDPDAVARPQRLEPVVVADRVSVVLVLVAHEVHTERRALEARQASVVVDRAIADRAGGQLDGATGWLAVGQAAATTERPARPVGRGPALEADGRDHALNRPVSPAPSPGNAVPSPPRRRWSS